MNNRLDILAPAGNFEMLKAAVYAGANSVYLGLSGFNARRSAENFDSATLPRAVQFCHGRGVRVNVALNTLVADRELGALEQAVRTVAESGADAVILQDLAVAKLVRQMAPGLALHASTQMSVTSLEGAKLLAQAGFSRVILARELTGPEVEYITKNCGIETEIFIHGAHCVSVSGQCYMSAFFGGRSGNRGACAGPCRLPYTANGKTGALLSLKDLSLMDQLPQIAQMGVCCVKIEGRLRSCEYVAAAVSAARAALEGKPYDRQLLARAFSRDGFTEGFFENHYLDGQMFGQRTEADGADTKAALPALRELYRREFPGVGVQFDLSLVADELKLVVSDGENRVVKSCKVECQKAEKPQTEAICRSLEKCGGTPFYPKQVICHIPDEVYVPLKEVNGLRRQVLEELLRQREVLHPYPCGKAPALPQGRKVRPKQPLALWAHFESPNQMTDQAQQLLEGYTLPLCWAAEHDPAPKAAAALSRGIFDEAEEEQKLLKAWERGWRVFEAQSVCGLGLLRRVLPQAQLRCGFGCNVTNTLAQQAYEEWGAKTVTLSPELPLTEAAKLGGSVPRGVLVYGHLPLMLLRTCPIRQTTTCDKCAANGSLTDRKGEQIRVLCQGQHPGASRQLLNPVPLWLADRLQEVQVEYAVLYFTTETAAQVDAVLQAFQKQQPCPGGFTRGLAYKNIFAGQPASKREEV